MRILVLGITGMLGNAIFRFLSEDKQHQVYGTARNNSNLLTCFHEKNKQKIIKNVDVLNYDLLTDILAQVNPDVVINCVGIVKQLSISNNPLYTVPINTLLPHRLAILCQVSRARLVHISTDCVFSGKQGGYTEDDFPDAADLYGRSKLLGEVDYLNAITLRTSIIGHEIVGNKSLVNWFLHQNQAVNGFRRAIFSGLPAVELARVINKHVLPNDDLHGLYHVASEPISKYSLLCLISEVYKKNINITPSDEFVIDRSLNSDKFKNATNYAPPKWIDLVKSMHYFK
ncbi:MAG: NAD(P)-dependent oxidoreductase [Proteobacteria bacterium]|nr:MAG: NAD(P)-dependent oxidoreductase [Pseudomonadota bacterium]